MHSFRAIVIDDEKKSRDIITRFLDNRDIDYDIAKNVNEAQKKLGRNKYDLVFLDLYLKSNDPNGLDLLEWMKINKRDFITIIVSVIAYNPKVIIATNRYSFVRLRLTAEQVRELAFLIDDIIAAIRNFNFSNLLSRISIGIIAVILAGLATFLGQKGLGGSGGITLSMIVFGTLSAFIFIFAPSIIKKIGSFFRM